MSRVFANGPGEQGSIQRLKFFFFFAAALLNTQHYKELIKANVEQSGMESRPLLHLGVVAIEKGAFG